MLKTNRDKLVMQSMLGAIHHPVGPPIPFRLGRDNQAHVLPATGGITYNVKNGDSAFGWAGDHVEPGVSIQNPDRNENGALNLFSCIGNVAKIVSGDGKGHCGYVTGSHGGVEHVLTCFDEETLDLLAIGDKIQICSCGQGMVLHDHSDIDVMNIDPDLFEKLGITEKDGILTVPVTTKVPAYLMGSGMGAVTSRKGDYDIMTGDQDAVKEFNLDRIRLGDIVLLQDCDNTVGRGYLKGAVTIGVVIHCDCIKMGHGPGVTAILSTQKPLIKGKIVDRANVADYMK